MQAPPSPPEGCIGCEQRGALLLIGINRPAKYNGFTPRMFRELGVRSFVEKRPAKFTGR
jgi:enoyl-CoA hydratase